MINYQTDMLVTEEKMSKWFGWNCEFEIWKLLEYQGGVLK